MSRAKPIYLLIAGPGRSGSTFLYSILNAVPEVCSPGIKELYLYRNRHALEQEMTRTSKSQPVLLDVANRAFRDKSLVDFIRDFNANNCQNSFRLVVVYLFRRQTERLVSVLNFRKSRGQLEAYLPADIAEKRIVLDTLKPSDIETCINGIHSTYILDFDYLMAPPEKVVEMMEEVLGIGLTYVRPTHDSRNRSVRPRNVVLATFGTLVAKLLRKLHFGRLLQGLKDNSFTQAIFFSRNEPDKVQFSATTQAQLVAADEELRLFVDQNFQKRRGYWERSS